MCYMSRRRVAVRELRQNLSVHLKKVAAGETLEVTDRGRPVAILAPLPEQATPLARLRASGRVQRAATRSGKIPSPLKLRLPISLSGALEAERGERL